MRRVCVNCNSVDLEHNIVRLFVAIIIIVHIALKTVFELLKGKMFDKCD